MFFDDQGGSFLPILLGLIEGKGTSGLTSDPPLVDHRILLRYYLLL